MKERERKKRKHTQLFAVDPHFIILIYIFENNGENGFWARNYVKKRIY